MDTAVFIAVLTLFGTICGGLFKIISDQTKAHTSLSKALDKNTTSNEKIAKATIRAADEAKERNGHLADMIETAKVEALAKVDTLKVDIENVKIQHVDKQIMHKEAKKK